MLEKIQTIEKLSEELNKYFKPKVLHLIRKEIFYRGLYSNRNINDISSLEYYVDNDNITVSFEVHTGRSNYDEHIIMLSEIEWSKI